MKKQAYKLRKHYKFNDANSAILIHGKGFLYEAVILSSDLTELQNIV